MVVNRAAPINPSLQSSSMRTCVHARSIKRKAASVAMTAWREMVGHKRNKVFLHQYLRHASTLGVSSNAVLGRISARG